MYKITCNLCKKFYIGETSRPFRLRFEEHRRSLQGGDGRSALSEHAIHDHFDLSLTADDFYFSFVAKFRTPVEARISEARFIDVLKPQLNRRLEKAQW